MDLSSREGVLLMKGDAIIKISFGLFLFGCICASVWILPRLSSLPSWLVAVPLSVALIIGVRGNEGENVAVEKIAVLSKVGVVLALGLALEYRFTYLTTVPSPTNSGETGFFTGLAAKFAGEGFSYTSYQGYMHTGYAYLGALGMLLSSEWDWGFRFATAVASALTVVTSLLAIRALSPKGSAAGWIGAGLLASSPWHLFISRFLMQKFLLTLCESITLLGLIVAVTGATSARRYCAAILAAVGFVLGLHTYWGCYVLAATWTTFLLYLIIFHRSYARQFLGPLVVASVLALIVSLPAIEVVAGHRAPLGYVKTKFDFGDDVFLNKVMRNIEYVFWGLSASINKGGSPYVTAPVAFLFLVGLIRAVKRFRSSIPSALILINFAWFFAGIVATWAHNMYMTGLIFSVYCLAAQGAVWIGQALASAFGGGRLLLLGIAPLALVGHQGVTNYKKALFSPIAGHSPYQQPASHLFDQIRAFSETHSVWLPMRGLGDTLARNHNLKYPEYAFVSKLHTFDANIPLFDTRAIEDSAGIELYLLPTPLSEILINDSLKVLYPNLVVTHLGAPPPYDQMPQYRSPTALRVSISLSDVMQLKTTSGVTLGDKIENRGFLAVTREGFYSFCYQESSKPRLVINNEPFEMMSCSEHAASQRLVFLGVGVHQVVVQSQLESSALKIISRHQDGTERPLQDLLWGFTTPSVQEWAKKNRGVLGKRSSFVYEVAEMFPNIAEKILKISGLNTNTAVLSGWDGLLTFNRGSSTTQRYLPSIDQEVMLGRPGTPLLIGNRGGTKVFAVLGDQMNLVFDAKSIAILDFDQQGDRLALLRSDGQVIITEKGGVETTIKITPAKPATSVAWISDTLYVATPEGIYYRKLSTGTSGRIAGDFSVLKNLSSDVDGNLYAWSPHQKEPTRVFSSSALQLYNAAANSTAIFLSQKGEPIRGLNLPKFLSDDVFAAYGNNLLIFRKKPVASVAPVQTP